MADQPLPKIVLFGDSLTEWSFDRDDDKGFGQVISERYKGRAEVWNKGSSSLNISAHHYLQCLTYAW
jgi:lysophospholipase L1-like esterase